MSTNDVPRTHPVFMSFVDSFHYDGIRKFFFSCFLFENRQNKRKRKINGLRWKDFFNIRLGDLRIRDQNLCIWSLRSLRYGTPMEMTHTRDGLSLISNGVLLFTTNFYWKIYEKLD